MVASPVGRVRVRRPHFARAPSDSDSQLRNGVRTASAALPVLGYEDGMATRGEALEYLAQQLWSCHSPYID